MDFGLFLNQSDSLHAVDAPSEMLTLSSSENNLKFICEFKPGSGPLPGSDDCNADMDCKSVSVIIPAQCSIYQLRLRICMQVGTPTFDDLLVKCVFKIFDYVFKKYIYIYIYS